MARPRWAWGREVGLALLGLASLLPYIYALQQPNLRQDRAALALAVGAALACYLPAAFLVIRDHAPTPRGRLLLIVGFAIAFRGLLIFTQPVISDDMYRYVWDGRVQAAGINPYAFPPEAAEVSALRDGEIWYMVLPPLVGIRFQVLFHPPYRSTFHLSLTVLVHYRSERNI